MKYVYMNTYHNDIDLGNGVIIPAKSSVINNLPVNETMKQLQRMGVLKVIVHQDIEEINSSKNLSASESERNRRAAIAAKLSKSKSNNVNSNDSTKKVEKPTKMSNNKGK